MIAEEYADSLVAVEVLDSIVALEEKSTIDSFIKNLEKLEEDTKDLCQVVTAVVDGLSRNEFFIQNIDDF